MTSAAPASRPRSAVPVIVTAMVATAVGQGFARLTYVVVLPAVVADLAGSYSRAGLLGTVNLVAYLGGVLVVTTVAARADPALLLTFGLSGTIAGLVLAGVAPSYGVLTAAMIVAGFFSAAVWLPVTTIVSAAAPPGRRGLALGAIVAGFGASVVVSAQLATLVRALGGPGAWRPVWLIEAALGVVTLACVLVVIPPGRPRGTAPLHPSAPWRGRAALASVRGWRAITATYAAYGIGYTLYTTYLVSALRSDAGFSVGHAGIDFTVLGACSIVGGMLVGRISDRAGRRPVLGACAVLQIGCALLVLVHGEPWAILSAAVFGLLMTGTGTVVTAYVGDHSEPRAMAAAFGAVTLAFGVTQAAGPWLGGWLADRSGSFTMTFAVAAAAYAVSAVAALSLPSRPVLSAAVAPTTSAG